MSADPKDSARKCSSPSALLFTADLLEFFLHPPFWVVYICFCFIVPLFFPHKYFSCSSRFQSTTSLLLHCFTRKCRTSRLELPPLISTRNSTWKRSAQSTAPEGDHPHYSLCECPLWPAWRTLSLSLSLSFSLSLSHTHTHKHTHTHTPLLHLSEFWLTYLTRLPWSLWPEVLFFCLFFLFRSFWSYEAPHFLSR